MLYRISGVRFFNYKKANRKLPIPFDRYLALTLLIAGVAAPTLIDDLFVTIYLLPWIIWCAAILGINIIVGWGGQLHLGYAAIMAIGAYTYVHVAQIGVNWIIALVIAGGSAASVGALFAITALRVKGLYLALTTLALQFVVDWVLSHVPAITGGSQAALQVPRPRLFSGLEISGAGLYYVALGWCVLVTLFVLNLKRSALGRALIAVREKDYAAEILGVRSFWYKLVAFMTSAFVGGVSGAILVITYYKLITPEQFTIDVSIQALAMVVIGGLGSIIGTYLGVAIILLLPGILAISISSFAQLTHLNFNIEMLAHIPTAIYGVLIVAVLLIEPLGLGKLYNNVRSYFYTWPFGYSRE